MKKRWLAICLIAGIAAGCLLACGDRGTGQDIKNTQKTSVGQNTQGASDETNQADTQDRLGSADASDQAALAELTGLLGQIASSVEAGTAGASLKAVPTTLALMDWAAKYEIKDEAVTECTKQYVSGLESDACEEFRMQAELVYSDSRELLGENGQALLDDAGCDAPNYPYDAAKLTELDAVMRAFE